MMRSIVMTVLMVLAAVPNRAATQQRPDFSGAWIATEDAPAGVAAAPSPVLGERLELRHNGNALTVIRPIRERTIENAFELGGAEVRVTVPGRSCHADAQLIETVAWEGDGIAYTVVGAIPPGGGATAKLNVKRLLRLDGPETLVVTGSMTQAGETRPVATVYKRSRTPLPRPDAATAASNTTASISQVAWIGGVWIGGSAPTIVEERWTPPASGAMQGMARTLSGPRMSSFEFLCIAERDGSLVYVAMPDGRGPTSFVLTSVSADSATFENPAHDFPKRIRYSRLADGTLETAISGTATQRTMTVVLKRQP